MVASGGEGVKEDDLEEQQNNNKNMIKLLYTLRNF